MCGSILRCKNSTKSSPLPRLLRLWCTFAVYRCANVTGGVGGHDGTIVHFKYNRRPAWAVFFQFVPSGALTFTTALISGTLRPKERIERKPRTQVNLKISCFPCVRISVVKYFFLFHRAFLFALWLPLRRVRSAYEALRRPSSTVWGPPFQLLALALLVG